MTPLPDWHHLTQGAQEEAAVERKREARRQWFLDQPVIAVISEPATPRHPRTS